MPGRSRAGLTTPAFHILVALADGAAHGYAILKEVEERSNGEVRLRPGTLYRTITRLVEQGWIEQASPDVDPSDDERRKYYRLTGVGRERAREEALRLASMVRTARSKRLVTEADLR